MDLSDGLADAVRQVSDASGVGATIDGAALPIEPSARDWFVSRGVDPVRAALAGGDDYELLFTVSRSMRRRFFAATRLSGTPVTRIGVCTPDRELRVDQAGADTALPRGFSHFR
jgi:thiamine-monophosphate kinase